MKILFTLEKGDTRDTYFPPAFFEQMGEIGDVILNEKDTPLSSVELAELLPGVDVCVTHWDCPVFSCEALAKADRLKLIAHAAGSVADFVTEEVYDRGITVCSANKIMAKSVAEGTLADILAGLRFIPQQAYEVKYENIWHKRVKESRSLQNAHIGMIGLGTIGRDLLKLLVPFDPLIHVYDPYLDFRTLEDIKIKIVNSSLDDVLRWGDIVTFHASLTRETRGMIGARELSLLRDHALLVNTARSGIMNTQALIQELSSGRVNAVLDVFDEEPLPLSSPLREFENVTLLPHVAGITAKEEMSFAMLGEIKRFKNGLPLKYEISRRSFELMTQERLPENDTKELSC